jgi:hypothetical protein
MIPRLARPTLAALAAILAFWPPAVARSEPPALPGYTDYNALRAQLESIAATKLATLESLGKTLGGREVHLLRIGTGSLDDKPALLVVGSAVPSHLVGSELAVRMARQLVDRAKTDEAVRKLLDHVTVYVIPRPAPDACEAFFRKPYGDRNENDRPVDDDHDGRADEDGPNDLDGNGQITMMRVEDPSGRWMPHPDDPRVLIEADPKKDERGRWTVHSEGADDDQDDQFNEDSPGGTAFNRNFTFKYPCFKQGAGPHQVSEAETRAVADFAFSHKNIAAVFTFTPEDNLMHPWKPDPQAEGQPVKTAVLGADAPYLDFLADQYRKIHGGKDAPESPRGEGSFSEWAYFHYGRWSLAARAWWVPKVEPAAKKAAGAKDEKAEPKEDAKKPPAETRGADDLNALRWFAREKIDGFVQWKPFQHPDFPGRKVETGGFRPFVRLNPPAGQIGPLAEKHLTFLLRLADLLPALEIRDTKAEPLGAGVWRVTAVVRNRGYLPTFPKMGEMTRQTQPVQVAVALPEGAGLVTGSSRIQLPVLAGDGGRVEQSWLLRAPEGKAATIEIRAWAPAVGEVRSEVKLP